MNIISSGMRLDYVLDCQSILVDRMPVFLKLLILDRDRVSPLFLP